MEQKRAVGLRPRRAGSPMREMGVSEVGSVQRRRAGGMPGALG